MISFKMFEFWYYTSIVHGLPETKYNFCFMNGELQQILLEISLFEISFFCSYARLLRVMNTFFSSYFDFRLSTWGNESINFFNVEYFLLELHFYNRKSSPYNTVHPSSLSTSGRVKIRLPIGILVVWGLLKWLFVDVG